VIGITGTKGKSTISSLTYDALKKAKFTAKLVGNIGLPVLDEIDLLKGKKYDYVVYEMSSYMLDHFAPKNFISVVNNVYTCHLDWHKTFENYQDAKLNILRKSKYKLVHNVFAHLAGKEDVLTF
jgi:UDP-N-acetylmuramoylalanine-D-glutamate ligase